MKKSDDKIMGSIVLGALFVITLNVVQLLVSYFFKNFTTMHPYITAFISGASGWFVAVTVTERFFENPFGKSNKK